MYSSGCGLLVPFPTNSRSHVEIVLPGSRHMADGEALRLLCRLAESRQVKIRHRTSTNHTQIQYEKRPQNTWDAFHSEAKSANVSNTSRCTVFVSLRVNIICQDIHGLVVTYQLRSTPLEAYGAHAPDAREYSARCTVAGVVFVLGHYILARGRQLRKVRARVCR